MEQIAHEVQEDMMHEMKNQMANAHHVIQDYLHECRKRFIDWGCNAKCVDAHTNNLQDMASINRECQCPAPVTVSGDTRVLMQ
tara:strand:- start:144 stop:392 length:249 start_codon:yes stop_codon:yes gene_type:complete